MVSDFVDEHNGLLAGLLGITDEQFLIDKMQFQDLKRLLEYCLSMEEKTRSIGIMISS